jgi:hypothetical protein
MRTRRRRGAARHETDIRSWPLIGANALVVAAIGVGATLVLWGELRIGPPSFTDHGHRIFENDGGRADALAGLLVLRDAVVAWALGAAGYTICAYGRKMPLEIKVDGVAAEVRDLGDGLGRIEDVLTDAVAGEIGRRGARHRRERWLHSVR